MLGIIFIITIMIMTHQLSSFNWFKNSISIAADLDHKYSISPVRSGSNLDKSKLTESSSHYFNPRYGSIDGIKCWNSPSKCDILFLPMTLAIRKERIVIPTYSCSTSLAIGHIEYTVLCHKRSFLSYLACF